MDLSVLVVSWNTRDLLRGCLASIPASCGGLSHEVIVVDNASADGSADMVGTEFPSVHLIRNCANVGFARANNQAIACSSGRYLLLLNPDTEVLDNALSMLVRFMDGTPRAGAAGAMLLNGDMTLQESCHPLPTLPREVWRLLHLDALRPWARYRSDRWQLDTPREVDAVQGACLILRRKAIDQTGPLDEDYFMYSEEIDLCRRLRSRDWAVYWEPRSRVVHYVGRSAAQVPGHMFVRFYQGKIMYFRKHHGRLAATLYKLVLLLAGTSRLMLAPIALMESAPRRALHLALAGRYWNLIRALPSL